jgi:hypothetical protein
MNKTLGISKGFWESVKVNLRYFIEEFRLNEANSVFVSGKKLWIEKLLRENEQNIVLQVTFKEIGKFEKWSLQYLRNLLILLFEFVSLILVLLAVLFPILRNLFDLLSHCQQWYFVPDRWWTSAHTIRLIQHWYVHHWVVHVYLICILNFHLYFRLHPADHQHVLR